MEKRKPRILTARREDLEYIRKFNFIYGFSNKVIKTFRETFPEFERKDQIKLFAMSAGLNIDISDPAGELRKLSSEQRLMRFDEILQEIQFICENRLDFLTESKKPKSELEREIKFR